MITEEQIRELAHSIWEEEGRPEGKDLEHYFRAKKILEDRESSRVIELAAPAPITELVSPPPTIKIGPPTRNQRRNRKKR